MSAPDHGAGPSATEVDHVVINALFDLDAARALFTTLGFAVSPRGYHSLGSMNHLVMSSGAYLELVGVPRSRPGCARIGGMPTAHHRGQAPEEN